MKIRVVIAMILSSSCSEQEVLEDTSVKVQSDVALFISGSDLNSDGKLSYDEFKKSIDENSLTAMSETSLKDVFAVYDLDSDQFITFEEMSALARENVPN